MYKLEVNGEIEIINENAESLDIFLDNQTYYIIIRPFNGEIAFAYSIYPVLEKDLGNNRLRQFESYKSYVILVKKDNIIKAISKNRIYIKEIYHVL